MRDWVWNSATTHLSDITAMSENVTAVMWRFMNQTFCIDGWCLSRKDRRKEGTIPQAHSWLNSLTHEAQTLWHQRQVLGLSLDRYMLLPLYNVSDTSIFPLKLSLREGTSHYSCNRLIGMCCWMGWGCIFMSGLTIMGLHFHKSYYNGHHTFPILGLRKFL